ncbi:MAG TPA: DUF1579 domain-containing protein [Candidatus Polarisedimenticolia bacterium]|nr:DUF1579 domain-containing protein [Candidatus Polarisedimenticolia bacterium]
MRSRAPLAVCIALIAGLAGPAEPAFPAPARAFAAAAAAAGGQDAFLQRDVGVWDATIQILDPEDGSIGVYNGTETNTLAPGGRWLVTDFSSRIGGEAFEGHALFGYDPEKQRYVRLWVDSSQPHFWPSEGSYDPATDTLTMWMESVDSDGRPTRWRTVTAWKDDDTRSFTMHLPGPESVEAAGMTITYKRRR